MKIFTCTKDTPYNKDIVADHFQHPSAVDDGECSDGCCDFYKCPICGLRFRVELGQ